MIVTMTIKRVKEEQKVQLKEEKEKGKKIVMMIESHDKNQLKRVKMTINLIKESLQMKIMMVNQID